MVQTPDDHTPTPAIEGEDPRGLRVLRDGTLGTEGQLWCLSGVGGPEALAGGWRGGAPAGPGPAKDTRLDVGSHDVTGDVEVDADELALSNRKTQEVVSPPASAPRPFLQASGQGHGREHWGARGIPQPQSHRELVGRNHQF